EDRRVGELSRLEEGAVRLRVDVDIVEASGLRPLLRPGTLAPGRFRQAIPVFRRIVGTGEDPGSEAPWCKQLALLVVLRPRGPHLRGLGRESSQSEPSRRGQGQQAPSFGENHVHNLSLWPVGRSKAIESRRGPVLPEPSVTEDRSGSQPLTSGGNG